MNIYELTETDKFAAIDARSGMYPCYGFLATGNRGFADASRFVYSTLYGYATDYTIIKAGMSEIRLQPKEYTCLPIKKDGPIEINTQGVFFGVFRLGFQGQFIIGEVENRGRLCYIDGCSDSLLVYPPRQGDPSLNSLHFPPGIKQSFHTHPSIRMGFVSDGNGHAWNGEKSLVPLKTGQAFLLNEQELHRFSTEDSPMTVIAFHPDGDWGPTDQNHTMLNRTYLK